jgi:sterol desaturase/sphingolipid hydroxylase (fatty acid hydroxylase superfamily)
MCYKMDIVKKVLPSFLHPDRLMNYTYNLITDVPRLITFFGLNTPLIYTIYNKSFDTNIFLISYMGCGFVQGVVILFLYYISDVFFFGKMIDVDAFKKTKFYDVIIFNIDTIYLYILGATVYTSLTVVPESMKYTLVFPGYSAMGLQFLFMFILHDIFFTLIHYVVHKIPSLRIPHLKVHHECPFDIANSRCAVASNGTEAVVRDLYSLVIPTYIIGYFGMPIYIWTWFIYYSLYSFWVMYIHSGVNVYHRIHHSETPNINYGLYYISDYFMGTLVLDQEKKE